MAISSDGRLWSWGHATQGQLGLGPICTETGCISTPTRVLGIPKVVDVATAYFHSLAVDSDGNGWSWGWGENGQLGQGNEFSAVVPLQIYAFNKRNVKLKSVAAGNKHSMALSTDGSVFVWGSNEDNELGVGHDIPCEVEPTLIPANQFLDSCHITKIDAKGSASAAISDDGRLFTWGFGPLGLGKLQDSQEYPTQVSLSNVKSVSLGERHSVALCADGSVWSWGFGNDGQLGDGANQNYVIPHRVSLSQPIKGWSCGGVHSIVLSQDGCAFGCGYAHSGQLGLGECNKAIQVPEKIEALNNNSLVVLSSSCGGLHSMALVGFRISLFNGSRKL
eukprot:TRINITY_DN93983_c0_g1_i1.p1 TRINITY_DN93983_c0_g1~~TRINITY_DN93983_c0_g1_i1.p1  ORF type:complete len:334 (+),score=4.27 TRINITY_DN93983_c0_g1_i1:320-1321(+)